MLQSENYKNGDVIALFLENCADFPAIWLGLSKLGIVTSWVNINLKAEPLAHSIEISKSSSVITSSTLFPGLFSWFIKIFIELWSLVGFLILNKECRCRIAHPGSTIPPVNGGLRNHNTIEQQMHLKRKPRTNAK